MKTAVYKFDEAPNISLLDKRVVWWNEKYICIKEKGGKKCSLNQNT